LTILDSQNIDSQVALMKMKFMGFLFFRLINEWLKTTHMRINLCMYVYELTLRYMYVCM